MKYVIILFTLLFLCACSQKTSTGLAALSEDAEVLVLENDEPVPLKSIFIRDMKVGDPGYPTDCSYTAQINKAVEKARKEGANIVQVVNVKMPNMNTACYKLRLKIYRNNSSAEMALLKKKAEEANKPRIPSDADYALVYFYRPKKLSGVVVGYGVKNGKGEKIGHISNGSKFTYKVKSFGKQTFTAKTESKTSIQLDIQQGKEYFVRCGLKMGVLVGRPDLEIVEHRIAYKEFDAIK